MKNSTLLGAIILVGAALLWHFTPAAGVVPGKTRAPFQERSDGQSVETYSDQRGEAPEPVVLVPGSAAARAHQIAASNFLPEDWEPDAKSEILKGYEEFIDRTSRAPHPKTTRQVQSSSHDVLLVNRTADGVERLKQPFEKN